MHKVKNWKCIRQHTIDAVVQDWILWQLWDFS